MKEISTPKRKVMDFVHKYLEVNDAAEEVIAEYALKTWQPLEDTVKYLHFLGRPGTGKTRAGQVMEAICKNSFNTAPYIIDSLTLLKVMNDKYPCTLILDMSEWFAADEVEKILRVGNMRYANIIKMQEGKVPETFRIFGYKVILSPRAFRDSAIQARCITIELNHLTRTDIPIALGEGFKNDCDDIQRFLSVLYAEEHEC